MYAGSLGAVEAPDDTNAAAEYLRARWADFAGLYPRILDTQHRAAVAAAELTRQGDAQGAAQARDVIKRLGEIAQAHNDIVARAETVGEYIGLSGYRGLGAIPVAAGVALVAMAGLMAWVFRAYASESEKLRLIELGVLTPSEAAALSVGPRPTELLTGARDLGTLALIGFGLWLSWQFLEAGGFLTKKPRRARRNPPLVVFNSNPPDVAEAGTFGDRVYALFYRHTDDGEDYVHEFDDGVELHARGDGTVCLEQENGRPLWADFDVVA